MNENTNNTGENTMNQLVTFEQGEARTTTLIIAEGTNVEHDSVIKLVRKYRDDLEEFGPCRFEIDMVKRPQGGGVQKEIALLNEQQSTLIITYLKNTEIVRQFKKALVRAFFELRDLAVAGRGGFDRRSEVQHRRGVTNPHGLDIKYTMNLSQLQEALTPAQSMVMIQRLTGIQLDDLPNMTDNDCFGDEVTVDDFYDDRCEQMSGRNTPADSMYKAFCDYCRSIRAKAVSQERFLSRFLVVDMHRQCIDTIPVGYVLTDDGPTYTNIRVVR